MDVSISALSPGDLLGSTLHGTAAIVSGRVELAGAINETVSFRFVMQTGDTPIQTPQLIGTALVGVNTHIADSSFSIYRMHPVRVGRRPGWHVRTIVPSARNDEPLDVLVPIRAPRGGLPPVLAPHSVYYFWVDVLIPKGTFEGIYSAQVELWSAGRQVAALPIELKVWPFVLPDRAELSLVAPVDHIALLEHHPRSGGATNVGNRTSQYRVRLDGVLISTLRMLHRHRLTPTLPNLMPRLRIRSDGGIMTDWSEFDRVVAPLMDGSAFAQHIPLKMWSIPLPLDLGQTGGALTVEHPELLSDYAQQCVTHFRDQGWLDRSAVIVGDPRYLSSEDTGQMCILAEILRNSSSELRIAARWFPQNMTPFGWFGFNQHNCAHLIDAWMPRAQYFDPQVMAEQRRAGKRTWLQSDRPPYSGTVSVHGPPSHTLALAWQGLRLGTDAIWLDTVNPWPSGKLNPLPEECVRFDSKTLIYPGRSFGLDEPVASVRLKRLRRSMLDAAYVSLLNRHGLEHVTATLTESLILYAGSDAYRTHFADPKTPGWAKDPQSYVLARRIMAEALVSRLQPTRDTTAIADFARTATWRRFMLQTRSTEIHCDGVRVRINPAQTQRQATIECAFNIWNGSRLPFAGSARFADLPQGWHCSDDDVLFGPIEPNRFGAFRLGCDANAMPMDAAGKLSLPVTVVDESGKKTSLAARVSFITATNIVEPIRIDGDLSDWPPGTGNVAGDFRLISWGENFADPDSAKPTHRTTGFVMRDDKALYVAINCEFDPAKLTLNASHKRIRYDDLIPTNDELVELLFDPLNAGTRSPSDLYRIAIKPTGSDVTEVGPRLDAPCGRSRPWPVDIDVATMIHSDRWTVEVRIPFSAFGNVSSSGVVWGFTIARFDYANQEFGTWSQANPNAYDPMSLGNLFLP